MNTPIPTVSPRRRWPRTLLVMLAVGAAIGVLMLALVAWALLGVVDAPISVVVDGVEQWPPLALSSMPPAHKVALLIGLALAALALVVVVPVAILLGLAAALIGIVLGVGLPVVVALAALALVASPFVLIGWGLWALLRPARNASGAEPPSTATPATTIQG